MLLRCGHQSPRLALLLGLPIHPPTRACHPSGAADSLEAQKCIIPHDWTGVHTQECQKSCRFLKLRMTSAHLIYHQFIRGLFLSLELSNRAIFCGHEDPFQHLSRQNMQQSTSLKILLYTSWPGLNNRSAPIRMHCVGLATRPEVDRILVWVI